jgi:hypothetical protein
MQETAYLVNDDRSYHYTNTKSHPGNLRISQFLTSSLGGLASFVLYYQWELFELFVLLAGLWVVGRRVLQVVKRLAITAFGFIWRSVMREIEFRTGTDGGALLAAAAEAATAAGSGANEAPLAVGATAEAVARRIPRFYGLHRLWEDDDVQCQWLLEDGRCCIWNSSLEVNDALLCTTHVRMMRAWLERQARR